MLRGQVLLWAAPLFVACGARTSLPGLPLELSGADGGVDDGAASNAGLCPLEPPEPGTLCSLSSVPYPCIAEGTPNTPYACNSQTNDTAVNSPYTYFCEYAHSEGPPTVVWCSNRCTWTLTFGNMRPEVPGGICAVEPCQHDEQELPGLDECISEDGRECCTCNVNTGTMANCAPCGPNSGFLSGNCPPGQACCALQQ